jgi:hypothetical protein
VITGFPAVGDGPWELRLTCHALVDLGADAARDTPGDIPAVRHLTTYSRVVEDFLVKRNDRPDAPGDPLHSVGRPDIISLHSAAGGRSVTWHDPDNAVVWFLGFSPEHDYSLFEQRAATGDLLPDEDDEVLLEVERQERDFLTRVRPGLRELLDRTVATPAIPQRGTIGGILKLEVSAIVVRSGDDTLGDVWIIVHLPLQAQASEVPGWPGSDLLVTLARAVGAGDLDFTSQVPAQQGWRELDYASEMAVVTRNVVLDPDAALRPSADP